MHTYEMYPFFTAELYPSTPSKHGQKYRSEDVLPLRKVIVAARAIFQELDEEGNLFGALRRQLAGRASCPHSPIK